VRVRYLSREAPSQPVQTPDSLYLPRIAKKKTISFAVCDTPQPANPLLAKTSETNVQTCVYVRQQLCIGFCIDNLLLKKKEKKSIVGIFFFGTGKILNFD